MLVVQEKPRKPMRIVACVLLAALALVSWRWTVARNAARCAMEESAAARSEIEALKAKLTQTQTVATAATGTQSTSPKPSAPDVVYLADLPEAEVRLGWNWTLGKNGDMGYYFLKANPKHAGAAHALSAHAPSHIAYHLFRRFQTFKTTASLNVSAAAPQVFRVKLDGKTIWQSEPLQNEAQSMDCEVSVAGGEKLELESDPGGFGANTVWLEPRLIPAAGFNPDRDMPVFRPTPLAYRDVVGKSFRYYAKYGQNFTDCFTLDPSGRVAGYAHVNESIWEIDPAGVLVIKDANGLVTCRYEHVLKWGSCFYMEGPAFFPTNGYRHCLDGFPLPGQAVTPDPHF